MKIALQTIENRFVADLAKPYDLSIPLHFNGAQPNHYGVPKATKSVVRQGSFVGDVSEGGSCNCYRYEIVPHCNGTHTECVGHIIEKDLSLTELLKEGIFRGALVSVTPEEAMQSEDTYHPEKESGDMLITKKALENAISNRSSDFYSAIVVRTLPNDTSKKSRNYPENPPPFFSIEAIEYLVSLGTKHLIVDIPSVDRMYDDGELVVHRRFWHEAEHSTNTITEMIYVPDEVSDGEYLVEIQIPPFVADAAPSRVLLYPVSEEGS